MRKLRLRARAVRKRGGAKLTRGEVGEPDIARVISNWTGRLRGQGAGIRGCKVKYSLSVSGDTQTSGGVWHYSKPLNLRLDGQGF